MQKDIAGKRLEEYNDVFVDIFNNLVFAGSPVLSEDTLVPMPTESYGRRPSGAYRQGNLDIRKVDMKNGAYRLICGSENQHGRDNTMPLRVMGYDYSAYEEQMRLYMSENKKKERRHFWPTGVRL